VAHKIRKVKQTFLENHERSSSRGGGEIMGSRRLDQQVSRIHAQQRGRPDPIHDSTVSHANLYACCALALISFCVQIRSARGGFVTGLADDSSIEATGGLLHCKLQHLLQG
jgi:hypothetical protein